MDFCRCVSPEIVHVAASMPYCRKCGLRYDDAYWRTPSDHADPESSKPTYADTDGCYRTVTPEDIDSIRAKDPALPNDVNSYAPVRKAKQRKARRARNQQARASRKRNR